jgi:hypothetical protein
MKQKIFTKKLLTRKMKIYIFLFFISFSHFAFGQDGIFWSFEVKFKVGTAGINDNGKVNCLILKYCMKTVITNWQRATAAG